MKRQLEELQRNLDAKKREGGRRQGGRRRGGAGEHELRSAIRVAAGALTPAEVQRLRQILTNPQRALLDGLLREVRALLLDRDRER